MCATMVLPSALGDEIRINNFEGEILEHSDRGPAVEVLDGKWCGPEGKRCNNEAHGAGDLYSQVVPHQTQDDWDGKNSPRDTKGEDKDAEQFLG